MALDQGIFEYKRLFFGGGEEGIQALGLIHHQGGLGGEVLGRAEVGQNPFLQVLGLSHIKDPLRLILEDIDARALRQIETKGFGVQVMWGQGLHVMSRNFYASMKSTGF